MGKWTVFPTKYGTEVKAVPLKENVGYWIADDLTATTHVHKARGKVLGEIARIQRNFTQKVSLYSIQSASEAASGLWNVSVPTQPGCRCKASGKGAIEGNH